ncbi:efflux RND transporter periplasmic adaptor subunit [Mucilaginibacter sp. RS28]|uniref:Efflux RND transporter periplasmic adaptor subunit n=1 Tax=Mucilaginibacter straminoryzae TaxID=2932774 RepID=A0A9X1X5R9_9SPHI|nr:efflux RND transporter periplasmic adaptor subunit [Mucilaginibacter straminoryzae]MCJ8211071.1 efflux RND transporter periplasmic adaptor subunit [Mucilaginibacter straminoryzae]
MKNHSRYLLALVLPVLLASCSANQKDKEKKDTARMPVYVLTHKDTVLQKAYVADIQAMRNVEVRSRLKGFLENIFVDEGKPVRKGQVLFKVNDQEYRVALAKAKAALSNAMADAVATRLEVDRVKMLVDKKVISASELDVAKSKLAADQARIQEERANVQSAENHIAYTTIRAPFDGIIDRIPLKAGSLIDEGTLLTSISDISSVYAYFSFPENEYLQYQRTKNKLKQESNDSPVKLVLADGSSYAYSGNIETIEGEIEQNTGSIDLRAKFPNPNKLLRHGASGKIYISSEVDDAVMVPQKSVFDVQDKSFVYIVGPGNKLHMQSFEPLTRVSHYYIVRSGLKAGDRILYEGTQNVRDGMVIKPFVKAKSDAVAVR